MSRELKPCGTMAAARRHWRDGEEPCAPCREAELRYQRNRTGAKPFQPATCGTVSGYRRHLRSGEAACRECKAANAKNMREYKARRSAEQAA